MKRIIPILAALCLVVAMAVPALAVESDTMVYNGVELPDINSVWVDKENYPYAAMRLNDQGTYEFITSANAMTFGGTYIKYGPGHCYSLSEGSWVLDDSLSAPVRVLFNPFWSNHDIINVTDNSVYFSGSDPVNIHICVDSDGDDYCDVCGFFTPPPPGPLVEVMTELKEQNQLSQVLSQVVTMIPIGLACWVGYKGLRKSLDLLRRILHQA